MQELLVAFFGGLVKILVWEFKLIKLLRRSTMRRSILFAIPAILVCSVVVFGEDVGKGQVGEKMNAEQRMRSHHQ